MTGIDEDDYSLFSEVHALYMYSVHTYTHSTNLLGKQYKETKQTYLLLFLYTQSVPENNTESISNSFRNLFEILKEFMTSKNSHPG